MADEPLIERALEKIASHEAEISRLKMFINEADKLNGLEPRFEAGGFETVGRDVLLTVNRLATKRWQPGEFFNKPLATAVRSILLGRCAHDNQPSPASVDDIHEALNQGSFSFETSGIEAQKNSIRISLGKNSVSFVKLPNSDLFGLVEWYGKRPGKTGRKTNGITAPDSPDTPDQVDADALVEAADSAAAN